MCNSDVRPESVAFRIVMGPKISSLPCRQKRTQSRWNRTASWVAVQHSFCPSWAEGQRRARELHIEDNPGRTPQEEASARYSQWAAGPKQIFPNLPVPRIQLRPSEPPGDEWKGERKQNVTDVKYTSDEQMSQFHACFLNQKIIAALHTLYPAPPLHYITFNQPMRRLRWPPTLLCTSQGLVIADKSQPVIIMALEVRDRVSGREDDTLLLMFCKRQCPYLLVPLTYMTISFLVGLLETKPMASFSSVIGSVAFTMFWNMVLFLWWGEGENSQTDERHTGRWRLICHLPCTYLK